MTNTNTSEREEGEMIPGQDGAQRGLQVAAWQPIETNALRARAVARLANRPGSAIPSATAARALANDYPATFLALIGQPPAARRAAQDAISAEMYRVLQWARTCVPYPSDCHAAIDAVIARADQPLPEPPEVKP